MSTEPAELRPTFLARLARRPAPVFLGLAVGFLGCCVAGRLAARQQPYTDFVRFHVGIAPDSHHYPTYSQTLNLVRAHVRPGTVLVVVGGNSILHGVGQRADHVWTRHLQELLGDGFVVINLAMRASHPHEFASAFAERLAADGVPVVYVTTGADVFGPTSDWDGTTYKYLFWDGWGKGLVPPDERRDAWLKEGFVERYRGAPAARERRYLGLVDGTAYSRDLWNYIGYQYRCTVWTPMKYPRFWRPHRESVDDERGATIPFEAYFREENVATELRNLRALFTSPPGDALLRGDGDEELAAQYKGYLPDRAHGRTLFVFRLEALYYQNRLSPEDRAKYREVSRRYRDALLRAGLHAQLLGEDYDERDYADRSHFSEKGGRKVAEDLAPTVRAMSARLYGTNRAEGAQP